MPKFPVLQWWEKILVFAIYAAVILFCVYLIAPNPNGEGSIVFFGIFSGMVVIAFACAAVAVGVAFLARGCIFMWTRRQVILSAEWMTPARFRVAIIVLLAVAIFCGRIIFKR